MTSSQINDSEWTVNTIAFSIGSVCNREDDNRIKRFLKLVGLETSSCCLHGLGQRHRRDRESFGGGPKLLR